MPLLERPLSADVWRQCAAKRGLLQVDDPARYPGRFHCVGDRATFYLSLTQADTWAQLLRHHPHGGIDPFEVKRRSGRVRVTGLRVLDLTDPATRRTLRVTLRDLRGDDYAACQSIAARARTAGLDGILAPSAALRGATTLTVFQHARPKLKELRSRVGRPPARLRATARKVRRAAWA